MKKNSATNSKANQRYICNICGYIYDPHTGDSAMGVAPGTAFEDLPENWYCLECGAGKEYFSPFDD